MWKFSACVQIFYFYSKWRWITFFLNHMPQKSSDLLKKNWHMSWNFFIVHKDNIFLLYDTKNFRIALKFPDSNATLLPGFFSLWMHIDIVNPGFRSELYKTQNYCKINSLILWRKPSQKYFVKIIQPTVNLKYCEAILS